MSQDLQREYDKTQVNAFIGSTAAFFGAILCTLKMRWDSNIPTAATDGETLFWNPDWFLKLPTNTRKTVLMHELWHVALLHGPRLGSRDPEIWNQACDIYINNMLSGPEYKRDNYSFDGTKPWLDPDYEGWVEEDIYDDLVKNPQKQPKGSGGGAFGPGDCGDMLKPASAAVNANVVNNVVRAMHQQKLSGGAEPGKMPGRTEEVITQFLKPVVKWEALLERFFTELLDEDYTWARPNRRYQDIYLPSRFTDDGRLEHLAYFQDVSGSIQAKDSLRFNSELAYVWRKYAPEKMSIIQFDTIIQQTDELKEGDTFTEIKIVGRGGTDLREVREWIIKNKPTAAIIFSDLEVAPMEELPFDIPIIWVCIRNPRATVPFGKLIHINN